MKTIFQGLPVKSAIVVWILNLLTSGRSPGQKGCWLYLLLKIIGSISELMITKRNKQERQDQMTLPLVIRQLNPDSFNPHSASLGQQEISPIPNSILIHGHSQQRTNCYFLPMASTSLPSCSFERGLPNVA